MNDLVLAQATGPSPFGPIIIIGMIFAFFYFLVFRPQQQREKEKETFRNNLKKNEEVVSVGGFYGRVVDLKGPIVVIELAPNVRVRIDRRSIERPAAKKGADLKESEK